MHTESPTIAPNQSASAPEKRSVMPYLTQVVVAVITALVISAPGGALSFLLSAKSTTDKVVTVETQLGKVQAEVAGVRSEVSQEIKELRERTITRTEFESLKDTMKEMRDDIREIRAAQLQEQRQR